MNKGMERFVRVMLVITCLGFAVFTLAGAVVAVYAAFSWIGG